MEDVDDVAAVGEVFAYIVIAGSVGEEFAAVGRVLFEAGVDVFKGVVAEAFGTEFVPEFLGDADRLQAWQIWRMCRCRRRSCCACLSEIEGLGLCDDVLDCPGNR